MNSKVAVFGTLQYPSRNINKILPHLKALVEKTYLDDGSTAYDVAENPFEPWNG